ncbi:hypothetical protein CLD22_17285 [Rubrivivax gelatinosus]|nr:hypothetical protein [Rubrivivax gelatinosus]
MKTRLRLLLALLAAAVLLPVHAAADPDLWLEDGASTATRDWIAARNAETERRLVQDPRHEAQRQGFLAQGAASQHDEYLNGGLVHRLVSDTAHPLGSWQVRAASAAARAIVGAGWHTVLDLDELARREGVRWKFPLWWMNPMCDTTVGARCIVQLSADGGDRTVLREIDLRSGAFVDGGFRIDTPARHYAHWIDADHLLLASDFGPGTLSDAGYARQARVWTRGTPSSQARLVFDAPEDAVLYIPHNFRHASGTLFVAEVWHRAAGAPSWWLLDPQRGATRWQPPVDLVRYRGLAGIVGERLIAMTAKPLRHGDKTWPAGSLLALPLPGREAAIEPVFIPGEHDAVDPVFHLAVAQDALWLGVMHDVSGRLYRAVRGAGGWTLQRQPLPEHAAVRLLTGEAAPSAALVKTESLLRPPETTLRGPAGSETLGSEHSGFDTRRYVSEQYFATSRDGTRVPYYLVRPRAARADGRGAALISAYGGFGVSMLPTFLNAEFHTDFVRPMLEAGALQVHANIRGGGEYGPGWHHAAQRRERQRGVEDLIAVAEDLARRGWADRRRLAFVGASNGGLLAAAAAVQRPDLWRAVLADVPLTDMLRFHELLTGSVWIDEYGDPREPGDRTALAALSPLHTVRDGVLYPAMLVTTSSSDDRVHPGHARRFAEALRRRGNPVLFHESSDSGHGGAASRESVAALRALQTVFLLQTLGLDPAR